MKHPLLLCGLFLGGLFLSPEDSRAQWQPDVRLTNNSFHSFTSYNNASCIAASGDSVHTVWYDYRDGDTEIYYKRSTDGGKNWGADTRLTNNSGDSELPSVSVAGSVVHVVWYDNRDGNTEIYYKRSTDGGISWEPDTRLTNNSAESWSPSASVSGPVVHVLWHDLRDGNYEIYHKRSTDGGVSWGADTRLTDGTADSWFPSVSISGQAVHVVWHDLRDGNNEIYYKRSTDGGLSWGADTRLTNDPAFSWYSCISVSGQVVHVLWYDNRDGNFEIYYERSTDGGVSWGADTRLTNAPSGSAYPSVSVSGQVVHVVWYDNRDGASEIYYKRSPDEGVSWEADTRLTNDPGLSTYPSTSVSGVIVHVVWTEPRDGNYEIYYKRDPIGNPTGVSNPIGEIPKGYVLSQNYPNPFNPNTTIQFLLPHSEFVTLRIFNILGEQIAVLVSKNLSAGTHQVEWGPQDLPGGVYFYRLQAGAFIQTNKAILLK